MKKRADVMEKRTGKGGYLPGSYTVEAAFLVPIILGIFFAWLFQLFYLHDRTVISGMLQEVVIRQEEDNLEWEESSGESMDDGEGRGTEEDELNQGADNTIAETTGDQEGVQPLEERDRIQSHLWLVKIASFEKKKTIAGTKYILKSEATWNIPVMNRFLKNHFSYQVSCKTGGVRPETVVRVQRTGT